MTPTEPTRRAEIFAVVRDDHLHRIDAVARGLAVAGLQVHQVLASVGAVTGSIDSERIPALQAVEGVESVSPAREYASPAPIDPR